MSRDGVLTITFDFEVNALDIGPSGLTGIDVTFDFWDRGCVRCTDEAAGFDDDDLTPPDPLVEPPSPDPGPPSPEEERLNEVQERLITIDLIERESNKRALEDGDITQEDHDNREAELNEEESDLRTEELGLQAEVTQVEMEDLKDDLTFFFEDLGFDIDEIEDVLDNTPIEEPTVPSPPELRLKSEAPFLIGEQRRVQNGVRQVFDKALKEWVDVSVQFQLLEFTELNLGLAVNGTLFTGDPDGPVTIVSANRFSGVVAPVPLPATGALLLGGLALLGAAGWRRKTTRAVSYGPRD